MERLSDYNLDMLIHTQSRIMEFDDEDLPIYPAIYVSLNELKEYRQLKEQGRLIELPCRIGDTFYVVAGGQIYRCECIGYTLEQDMYFEYPWKIIGLSNYGKIYEMLADFGKTVFLTKEEAEKRLKEMEQS